MRPPLDALDLGGGAFADDAAFVDDDDAVGEGVGLFEVVGGEEDGFAAGGEGADLLPEAAAGFDVEADGGLVEEDEVGVAAEGEGEEDALLLAAAELAEHAVFDAFELGDADDVGEGQRVRVVAAEEVDVLADLSVSRTRATCSMAPTRVRVVAAAGVAAEDADVAEVG